MKTVRTDDDEKVLIAKNEYKLLKKLKHPHIVGVHSFHHNQMLGNVSIIMDYVEGETLSDIISEDGPFSLVQSRDITF